MFTNVRARSLGILSLTGFAVAVLPVAAVLLAVGALALPSAAASPLLAASSLYAAHAGGTAEHPQGYLGIEFRDQAPATVPAGRSPSAVEIVMVDHDGPAGKAGLQARDIVVGMDGHGIDRAEELRRRIRECAPGRLITLSVLRMGQLLLLSARLADRAELEHKAWLDPSTLPPPPPDEGVPPDEAFAAGDRTPATSRGLTTRGEAFLGNVLHMTPYTGAALGVLNPQLGEFFGAPPRTGMLVQSVQAGSPAALAGLRAGDIVLRVNGMAVRSGSDWMKLLRAGRGSPLRVTLLRDRHEQNLQLDLEARRHSVLIVPSWPWQQAHRGTE